MKEDLLIDIFIKISEAILPAEGVRTEDFRKRAQEFFENMPERGRMIFRTSCYLIEYSTIMGKFKRFSKLPLEDREKIIEKWYNSKIPQRRNIISFLKGLTTMIYASLKKEGLPC